MSAPDPRPDLPVDPPRRWPGLLLIGAAYRDAGKTRLATTLIGRLAGQGVVLAAKVTVVHEGDSEGCARGGKGCGVCSSLGGAPYVLAEEHGAQPDKDTARMLAAGAARVLWLRVAEPHLAEGRDALMAALGTDHPVVCESNTFRRTVEPDVFVVLRRAGSTAMKPSCRAVLSLADALFETDEERPCVWADAFSLVDGRWCLRRAATAVVLAGGASTRMGRDKALLELEGRALIERLVSALRPHFAEVLVSARRADDYAFLGCPVVPDPVPGQGPLCGMTQALAVASYDPVFFTPCDLATPPVELAVRLLRELGDADVALPRHADGKLEPLIAVLHRRMAPRLERTLARGERKILRGYEGADVRYVDLPATADVANLNTEADYAEALRRRAPLRQGSTMERLDIGFAEAWALTFQGLCPLPPEELPPAEAVGRVAARDLTARVDCPGTSTSARDGFAVRAEDVAAADLGHPVVLAVQGDAGAGHAARAAVTRGTAVRVTSGSTLPEGADAVLAAEFADDDGATVRCLRDAGVGRNVQARGSEVAAGEVLATRGRRVTPAVAGLAAASGLDLISVFRRPRVGLVATGDEVVAPGRALKAGEVYASNLVTLLAWLQLHGMRGVTRVAGDTAADIERAVTELLPEVDVLLTSGGAWKSARDLTPAVLTSLGWRARYRRVRMGPGKAVAFGLLGDKPCFCLPGGPASNEMAFLQLALPFLGALSGLPATPFPIARARLAAPIEGDLDWTWFVPVRLEPTPIGPLAHPMALRGRLRARAEADGLVALVEGVSRLEAGAEVDVQLLPTPGGPSATV